jgi:outer membrane protein TolC
VKTLAECIALAEAGQPLLAAAGAAVEAGHQRVIQVRAAYLPQVNASYSIDRRFTSASNRVGVPGATQSQTFTFYSASVNLSQVLFDFGQRLDQIRASQARERSLAADAESEHLTVVYDVSQAYFNVLAAQRLLAVADDTVRNVREQLDQAEGRYDVGMAARFDVTRSRVQLASAEFDQVTARNNVAVARETLRNAIGLDGPLDFDLVDTLDVARISVDEDQAVAAAVELRPDLRSVDEQIAARERDVRALRKQHLPSVGGFAAYGYSGTDYPLDNNWDFGASVTLPIFTGLRTSAEVGEARAEVRQLEAQQKSLRQQIELEVRQAVLDLRRADESITVADEGLVQARENLELASGRYQTGVGSVIELSDAQNALTSAEAKQVQSLYSYQISRAALEKATGRSWGGP